MKTDPEPDHYFSAKGNKAWEKVGSKEKEAVISKAVALDPADAVVPIIKGISS